ncbi:metallophosphoesterase [Rhodoferax ferrireducens T118]|uniref:Metallophosphoesterase n=1 Tax=Albidiferax ferrireducens (strain ATCC BAA-621 / DSM 15236 / T118) TaxID=338969 RepID=Q21TZ9_ALBFT|nr:DNA repair exonuclease [Rhodoferax ferrireducens]ABD70754.1 metallophosphoesterase [Rhodoferax ferrireducens T118]
MALKLLHSADWQIGRIYAQFEPDDAAALFEARFLSVERLATLATEHKVDAVLVAGDVFDAQTVSDKSIRRLFNAMMGYPGAWVMLPGNHDAALAESVWTRAHRLGVVPPNAVICLEPSVRIVGERFAVLPAPLTQRHTYGDLTEWFSFASTPEGLHRIGLAHGCVQGVLSDDVDSANPIAANRAATAGLDYLALGDWHGSKRIDERTWYAGTPETDRFRANDSGQALLVDIAAPGAVPDVQTLQIGRYRWQQMEPRLAVPSDLDETLQTLAETRSDDVLQIRVYGVCDLNGQRRLQQAVEAARARLRALVYESHALRLEPTEEDFASLRADGYVGEVLQQLRTEQDGPQADRARDALVVLARMLDELGSRPAATGTEARA